MSHPIMSESDEQWRQLADHAPHVRELIGRAGYAPELADLLEWRLARAGGPASTAGDLESRRPPEAA